MTRRIMPARPPGQASSAIYNAMRHAASSASQKQAAAHPGQERERHRQHEQDGGDNPVIDAIEPAAVGHFGGPFRPQHEYREKQASNRQEQHTPSLAPPLAGWSKP